MSVSRGFKEYVLEQLEQTTRHIRARAMFGGVGIYAGDDFFALIANDVLYFKVDERTRPRYTRRGMQPFQPYGPDAETMGYYSVPVSVLEDADVLQRWAAEAVMVARRSKARPRATAPRKAR
jgi:DNA transformation protein